MKKSLVASLFIVVTTFLLSPIPTHAFSGTPPVGQTGSWNMIFEDNFDGTSLDLTKWNPNWYGPKPTDITMPVTRPNEKGCYDPALISVAGGELTMRAESRPNCKTYDNFSDYTLNYATGIINTRTKFSFTYGYMEARMWLAGAANGKIANWPSFWANGTGTWPTTGEIDAMEGLDGDACWHFHYTGGGPGGCSKTTGNNPNAYHTYAASWEAGKVTFFYDGTQVGQLTSGITSAPMYLLSFYGIPANSVTTIPSTMRIDYIRVWQKGTSTSSPTPSPSLTPSPTPSPSPSLKPSPSPTPSPSPLPSPKPGDANGDSKVDGIDYVVWLNHYNQSVTGASNGDFNSSGKVDGVDYVLWLNNYGK